MTKYIFDIHLALMTCLTELTMADFLQELFEIQFRPYLDDLLPCPFPTQESAANK